MFIVLYYHISTEDDDDDEDVCDDDDDDDDLFVESDEEEGTNSFPGPQSHINRKAHSCDMGTNYQARTRTHTHTHTLCVCVLSACCTTSYTHTTIQYTCPLTQWDSVQCMRAIADKRS